MDTGISVRFTNTRLTVIEHELSAKESRGAMKAKQRI
jgi:hypothetical protein